ncbi:MAG: polysaccharide biosynthesis/export family protein [Pyrinomonadaceae bacterium]|nr:polysaccharide biosynthesis/export family protein [Pyrinomonadaceae bacterium]
MKLVNLMQKTGLAVLGFAVFSVTVLAQETTPNPSASPSQKRERVTKTETAKTETQPTSTPGEVKTEPTETTKTEAVPTETPAKTDDKQNGRQETLSEEEAAILPYLNNYLKEYHLGPEDVISVDVFGQPNYSKAGIVIPPTAKISYQLIPGGVFVGGKTTDQVAAEIAKKLDEYIIDPQVTVTLDKVGSAQFAVLGKVVAPGVRIMSKRYSIYDAVIESGGFAPNADKKRVLLIRHTPQGGLSQTAINFETLLNGKTEIPYLVPGDQIIVPEKKWSLSKLGDILTRASAFRILFGSPF